uniref:LRRNT domain-containing protein n=1 Tax=Sinocyclocheilus grahami TaxID=75366 RepID=A0A672QK25_SINGR
MTCAGLCKYAIFCHLTFSLLQSVICCLYHSGLTIMSASSSVLGVALLLLHLCGTHSFPTSACPVPCLCQHSPLLNCSSLGLTEIPTRIPATAVSLNISNNALRSLAPLSFGHSLRKLNTLVDVSFNRWKCDCNLQTLRRWISFDSEMGDSSWQVVCASPPYHGGKDLQSEFVLAICLSVIITFIVAFILGVLLRPLLEKLWRRIQS